MTGFNVNCSECEYCRVGVGGWDDEDTPIPLYVCAKDAPLLIETDVINNTDCIFYIPKKHDN